MTVDTLTEAELIVETMSIELVTPDPDNPRDTLGELGELTDSIEANGIYQPLIVTPTGVLGGDDREIVMVVAGHRRLAAAKLAELTHVPVIVRADIDEQGRRSAQFVENFHRLDLGPIEKARALKQLADAGVLQKDIAATVGVTQPTVSKLLALNRLPEKAQEWVADGSMTQEDAVALAALPAARVAELCKDHKPTFFDIGRVKREVETAKKVADAQKTIKAKGWQTVDEDPEFFQQLGLEGDDRPVALDSDRDNPEGLLAHVDPTDHEPEPCHRVYVSPAGEIWPACAEPARHPRPEGWRSPAELVEAQQAKVAEEVESRRPKLPEPPVQQEDSPNILQGIRQKVLETVGPIKELCARVLTEDTGPAGLVIDFGVLAMLGDEDWDPKPAGDLLGLDVSSYNVDGLVEAITGDGAIDGLKVLHAWGLSRGLSALEELTDVVARGHEIGQADEWYVETSRKILSHLGAVCEFDGGAPTFDQFVAGIRTGETADTDDVDLDDERPTVTVEVYKLKGVYKRRCSECGDIDGQNTKEELANGRAADHLRDKHGIEVAA